jgi:hypothetical protein
MSDSQDWDAVRFQDKYTFQKAEEFFEDFGDDAKPWVNTPESISYNEADNYVDGKLREPCYRGRIFRLDTGGLLLIQFLRPQVWRIRFNEKLLTPIEISDYNTRTIVQDTGRALIDELDHAEDIDWDVEIEDNDDNLVLKSVIMETRPGTSQVTKKACIKLWVQKDPFRITATRVVNTTPAFFALPTAKTGEPPRTPPEEEVEAVIWQTKERGLQYGNGAVVLAIQRTPTARYVGFGEQGGSKFIKDQTFMNYFSRLNAKLCRVIS